jgi:hypothetical protein
MDPPVGWVGDEIASTGFSVFLDSIEYLHL